MIFQLTNIWRGPSCEPVHHTDAVHENPNHDQRRVEMFIPITDQIRDGSCIPNTKNVIA
jgi:hypothetical protein